MMISGSRETTQFARCPLQGDSQRVTEVTVLYKCQMMIGGLILKEIISFNLKRYTKYFIKSCQFCISFVQCDL